MKTSTLIQRGLSAGAIALVLAACENTPPPSAIEQLADEYLNELMASDSLMGTYYSIEGARHDRDGRPRSNNRCPLVNRMPSAH